MSNYKTYGTDPYQVLLIHGGPGAAGEMAPVAERLSGETGVVEAYQTKRTIDELLTELDDIIDKACDSPVTLCGYSWGAWLSYIYSATYPDKVRKLILISSGPFYEHYAPEIAAARRSRMSEEDKLAHDRLVSKLNRNGTTKSDDLRDFGRLMTQIDSYAPLPLEADSLNVDMEIYQRIWPEAGILRASGKLAEYGTSISCPVVAIHGTYDPHPYQGVIEPLSGLVKDFKYILLEKCGHTPWIERYARDRFYEVLLPELEK